MKKYLIPNMELLLLESADIITASNLPEISWDDFVGGGDLDI